MHWHHQGQVGASNGTKHGWGIWLTGRLKIAENQQQIGAGWSENTQ